MPQFRTINLGVYANDGTGDDLRTAFDKVNKNFADMTGSVANGTNLGSGVGIFAQLNISNLEFKSLVSSDSTVDISANSTSIDLKSQAKLESDPAPKLGANLDLDGHYITNGDVLAPIYGYNVPIIAGMLELLISSNQFTIDFGSFNDPAGGNGSPNSGITLDFGSFIDPPNNIIDFGTF
jgi:hypothetical protein